jgi:type IV pilus assembly protein PilM
MASIPDAYFKLIKRLFPVNSRKSVIGIDITPSLCKAVEVVSRNGVFEVARWSIEPLAEAGDKGVQAALGKIIAAFALTADPRPVVVALGGKGTLVRYVDMPRMSTQDLRRTFSFESDKYFPFPKDTVYTDCHILETQDGSRKMSVLVTAVKKDIMDGRMKLLKESGIDPLAVSLNSVAVANVFRVFAPAGFGGGSAAREFKACAVIDIGEAGANLMIIYAGLPCFNRDIFIGTQEIIKRVANILGMDAAQARHLLSQGQLTDEPARKGMEMVMSGLITEVRFSFDYFSTEKNLAVTQIFLTGDGALLAGVEAAFKSGMDIPAEIWDPFGKIAMAAGAAGEDLKGSGARLVTALGLALNEYD